jgi:hypothetical protein
MSSESQHPELPELEDLLRACDLLDKADLMNGGLYRLRWGSALMLVGTAGAAIVVISPIFGKLPANREAAFCRRLLSLNAQMGGMASFALQDDGWIVLHAGRGRRGLDAEELAVMLATVGKFADEFDNALYDEFYADDSDVSAPVDPDDVAADGPSDARDAGGPTMPEVAPEDVATD